MPTSRELAGALRRAWLRCVRPNDLNAYDRRRSSQNGEDGILGELFRRLGSGSRSFVEFGVGDGHECNGAALIAAGWHGLMIEGDPAAFAGLHARYGARAGMRLVNAYVDAANIAAIFAENAVPENVDLLSIDVDGNDFWLWEALGAYRPRVVVIEYNAAHPPPERWVLPYDPAHRWAGDDRYGASLAALESLGALLGYALVGTDANGVNAFFVRDDLLAAARFPRRDAAAAYHSNAYRVS